jgi:hypothetical protein
MIPYKTKEADIVDAVICDIKNVCKKKCKNSPTKQTLYLLSPSLKIPTRLSSFTIGGKR